jgi:hypothetical protein
MTPEQIAAQLVKRARDGIVRGIAPPREPEPKPKSEPPNRQVIRRQPMTVGPKRLERDVVRLEQRVAEALKTALSISFTSRGRRYTFGRNVGASRITVKVSSIAYHVRPEVEELARRLTAVRVCPKCAVVFPRNGRQKFCSPACAATFRTRRYRRRLAEGRAKRAAAANVARIESPAAVERRSKRAAARRRQRLAKKQRDTAERVPDERKHALHIMSDNRQYLQ